MIKKENGKKFTNKYSKTKGKTPEDSQFTLLIKENFKKNKTNPPACPTYDSYEETFHWSIERDCLDWDDIVKFNDMLYAENISYKDKIKMEGYVDKSLRKLYKKELK